MRRTYYSGLKIGNIGLEGELEYKLYLKSSNEDEYNELVEFIWDRERYLPAFDQRDSVRVDQKLIDVIWITLRENTKKLIFDYLENLTWYKGMSKFNPSEVKQKVIPLTPMVLEKVKRSLKKSIISNLDSYYEWNLPTFLDVEKLGIPKMGEQILSNFDFPVRDGDLPSVKEEKNVS